MMYTYKRRLRFPLRKKRKHYDKRALLTDPKSLSAFNRSRIKAALCCGIAVLLVLSFFLAGNAGKGVYSESKVAYAAQGGADDAYSDFDITFENSLINPKIILEQEMPVIYGIDFENIDDIGQSDDNFYFNVLPEDVKLEILRFMNEPKDFYVGAKGPQILIYHTHTEEAYRQIAGEEYVEAGKFYTKEQDSSILTVGEELKKALEGYGYTVLHDKTDHMVEGLKNAYSKSLVTVEKYSSQYPTLKVYIDVHRDASSNEKDYKTVDGNQCARVMFVVGPGKKPEEKPKFESNYKLALAVTNELENIKKGFTRPIRVQNSSKHYNQQISDMCLLVEVGHNSNTLEQAKNTAKLIAEALSRVIEIGGSQ